MDEISESYRNVFIDRMRRSTERARARLHEQGLHADDDPALSAPG
jgi:hypothetical protein